MTEKRFIFVIDNGEDTFYDLNENGEIMNMIDTEDMLNFLHEENEQLKKENKLIKETLSSIVFDNKNVEIMTNER